VCLDGCWSVLNKIFLTGKGSKTGIKFFETFFCAVYSGYTVGVQSNIREGAQHLLGYNTEIFNCFRWEIPWNVLSTNSESTLDLQLDLGIC
jgi:hypothetical protein